MTNFRSISWGERSLAGTFYLGLLPVFYFLPKRRDTSFLEHHFRQAAAICHLLIWVTAISGVTVALLSYLLVFHRDLYETLHLDGYLIGGLRKLFLCWAVFWLFGFGMACLGGMRIMPMVHRLAERVALVRATCILCLVFYGLLGLLVPAAAYASSLVPPQRDTGAVYMVYEDNGIFPRWLFALAFYRMAAAASRVYGPGSAVLQEISRESINNAIAHGKMVFIGSHGTKRGLMLKNDWILPEDVAAVPKNPALRLVYLTGCDSGEQRDAWVDAFSPADVVTYDRLSAVLEHAWWLWFRGPEVIENLESEIPHAV